MQISDNIKHVGLKMTPQRKIIYEVMLQLKHASIDDIITYLKEHGVDMTTSTVYRILNSFCEANLLTTVCHPATGKTLYDITNHPHHHVFKNNKTTDFDDPELTDIIMNYLMKKNISPKDIKRIQVQITLND